MALRVLSLSTVFPRPAEPAHGIFVARRLESLSRLAEVRVIAPVPVFEYGKGFRERSKPGEVPAARQMGAIPVLHPRWIYPPAGGVLNACWLAARLLPILHSLARAHPFDLIDAHFGYPDGIAASILAAAMGVPFTITLRGNETMHTQHAFLRGAMARAVCRASRVITVSEPLREFAISLGAAPERVRTIPNGVDAATFAPQNGAQAREKYGIAPDEKFVLCAGALIERKGHHFAIRALAEVLRRRSDVRLVIAGGAGREGFYESRLRDEVRALGLEGRVKFAGPVPPAELAGLMSAADVFCLASLREGWPNVVHEALACGCPVIASKVGGVPEMIPDGESGTIIPCRDQQALNAALQAALDRTWNRAAISEKARERSWEQVAAEVFTELEQVRAEHQGQREGKPCVS